MSDTAPSPLSDSFIKLRRAQKHISELEESIRLFLHVTPPQVSATVTTDNGKPAVQINMHSPPLPEEWPTILGDAIHNLRTTLDLAACECVRSNGKNDKGVLFPFCEKASEIDRIIKERNLKRAHPKIVAYIQSLAPYKGGNIALRAIHDLDIRDKHQSLMPTILSFSSPAVRFRNDDGTLCAPAVVGDPNAATDIKFGFPADTVFAGQDIIPTLHQLVALVDGILRSLAQIVQETKIT